MSYGTSDSTVISPITTEARNLNTPETSAAQRDDVSPATMPGSTPENRQKECSLLVSVASLMGTRVFAPIQYLCRKNRAKYAVHEHVKVAKEIDIFDTGHSQYKAIAQSEMLFFVFLMMTVNTIEVDYVVFN